MKDYFMGTFDESKHFYNVCILKFFTDVWTLSISMFLKVNVKMKATSPGHLRDYH